MRIVKPNADQLYVVMWCPSYESHRPILQLGDYITVSCLYDAASHVKNDGK